MNSLTFHFPVLLVFVLCIGLGQVLAQSSSATLTISYPADVHTTGMTPEELLNVEHRVGVILPLVAGSSDTLIVELGLEEGVYDLLRRAFPGSQTGVFDDGCALTVTGGLSKLNLGSYTGLDTFHIRAYLSSQGESSAILVSSD